MSQINLRLSNELRRTAEKFAKQHGYKSIQELAKEALREKLFEKESLMETLDIISDKKLVENIRQSMEDVRKGRLISGDELQRRWKARHATK